MRTDGGRCWGRVVGARFAEGPEVGVQPRGSVRMTQSPFARWIRIKSVCVCVCVYPYEQAWKNCLTSSYLVVAGHAVALSAAQRTPYLPGMTLYPESPKPSVPVAENPAQDLLSPFRRLWEAGWRAGDGSRPEGEARALFSGLAMDHWAGASLGEGPGPAGPGPRLSAS